MNPEDPRLQTLLEFLRFPSVSTQKTHLADMAACAEWLAALMKSNGLEAEVCGTGGHPVVLGWTRRDPAKRTVLIYGHYDVQPPDPLEEWESPPFEPVVRDGRVFARGATDNKGQLLAHVLGVAETLEADGAPPVNVIFLIEGEEEIGSPHLPAFIAENRERLACAAVAISDTGMAAPGWPTLSYALRGVAALECVVRGPARDLHSGIYGGVVMNPAAAAARLVAGLHDDNGRVAIAGFYDAVRGLEEWERRAAAEAPVGEKDFLEQTGAPALFGEAGFLPLEQIGARPTAEVNGIGGGYQGEGTKTVIPATALFKLTFRLVPDQKADDILTLAERHLRAHTPRGVTLEIRRGHSGEPFLSNPMRPYALAAQTALKKTFGRKPLLMREGGSIPILNVFQETLGAEVLLLALAWPDCRAHSPNENFPLENFAAGIRLNRIFLGEAAKAPPPGDVAPDLLEKAARTC